jgi:hypothetical protein
MRSVQASIHPSARKGLSENLAKAKFSEVRYSLELVILTKDHPFGRCA